MSFRTVDDRLQGKELDSLIRYKERRKKRIEQNNFDDFNNSTNGQYRRTKKTEKMNKMDNTIFVL